MKLKAHQVILLIAVAVMAFAALSCQAVPNYKARVEEATLSWQEEKAVLVQELQRETISKDQYLDERQALEEKFQKDIEKATETFKAEAKAEAERAGDIAKHALNPAELATYVLTVLLGAGGTYVAATKKAVAEDDWRDEERDRRRRARGEKTEPATV